MDKLFFSIFYFLFFISTISFITGCQQPQGENAVQSEEKAPGNQRIIDLEGAKNFRDLGGYSIGEGQTMVWGKLYRSDKLSELSDSDLETIQRLGIKTVVDLRAEWECQKDPSRLPKGIKTVNIHIWRQAWSAYYKLTNEELDSLQKVALKSDMSKSMADTYEAFPDEFPGEVSRFFDLLVDQNNYPLLFHCTAGTDRTGFLASLVLSLMGVPYDTIVDDYALSQTLRLGTQEKDTRIVATLEKIHREYGNVTNYLIHQSDKDERAKILEKVQLILSGKIP